MSVIRSKARWIAAGLGVVIVGVVGLAQLMLPGIAAHRIREQIGRYGSVHSAHVTASPAFELLWGSAQSATVTTGSLRMSFAQAAELLSSVGDFDKFDLNAQSFVLGPLAIRQATIHMRGNATQIEGNVERSSLQAFLPSGVEVQLVGSGNGEVHIRLRGNLFGVSGTTPAVISAQEGKLDVQAQGGPFGLPTITLFSDPRLLIDGLEMSATKPGVYRLKMSATLH
jgi:hypothetical protein